MAGDVMTTATAGAEGLPGSGRRRSCSATQARKNTDQATATRPQRGMPADERQSKLLSSQPTIRTRA